MKIVIMEPLGITEDTLKTLTMLLKADGHEIVAYSDRATSDDALIARIADAEVVILANQPLRENVTRHCAKLKLIDIAFTGVDHVDVEPLKARGVTICNAAGYATNAVAELVFGMIIDLYREMTPYDAVVRNGGARVGAGREIAGKTFGIVGTGAIGLHTASIATACGCHVLAYSRTERKEGIKIGIDYVDLDTLLQKADIVSLHVPLTDETVRLIGKRELALMKENAVLINTARGPVVDSYALADALKTGQIAGAGIDVFEMEPPIPAGHPLVKAPHTILTPHIAFATKESLYQRAVIVFDNVRKWLEGHPQNLV